MDRPTASRADCERLGPALLVAVLLAGVAWRVWLALTDDGIHWPDEVYQALEPAHQLVHGYGLSAWELVVGARHWTFPGFVAGLLALARGLGLDEPRAYLTLVRLVFVAISLGTGAGTYLLARRIGASRISAAAGAALFVLPAPLSYLSARPLSETATALPLVLGLALAWPADASRRARLLGAALLGVAVLLRVHSAIFCVGLVVALAARRRTRALLDCGGMLVGFAILHGLVDRLTWGAWFHSTRTYLHFHLVEQISVGDVGAQPAVYYLATLWASMPACLVLLVGLPAFAAVRDRQGRDLGLAALAYVALYCAVAHKELRFVLPALPVLAALAGLGVSAVAARLDGARALLPALTVVVIAAGSALAAGSLTMYGVGRWGAVPTTKSAYDDFGPLARLFFRAHARPDLCGLRVQLVRLLWTGAHSHLHRRVPIYPPSYDPGGTSGHYNHVVSLSSVRPPGEIVASERLADGREVVLVRTAPACVPDPSYRWQLEPDLVAARARAAPTLPR